METPRDKLLADGCSTDAKHKVCRSRGGESCAFDGAAIVLMPIADAAHVVHGPIACCGNAWAGRGVHSTAGDLHRRGFTTDITELDIVYGGEEKLATTVREVVVAENPDAVFVYATCVTGLIGEDLDAVCGRLASELALPVVPVHAPGFVGPKNLGNRIAGEALLEHVIGTAEPVCVTPTDITLIGEYNVAGDLDVVEPLLRECGIRVLSRITGNARFAEIRYAHRAKLSVTVCSRALVNVAAALQRRWGVPNVEASFFGPTEIARSLRLIAAALEDASPEAAGVADRVEQVIATRVADAAAQLSPHFSVLAGKRAVLYSGGVKSWSMVSCLRDLGVDVIAVGAKKTSAEDEEKLAAIAPEVPILGDTSPKVLRILMSGDALTSGDTVLVPRGAGADILVAGGRNRYLAAKEGWPFIDVNQERESAYAGYKGFLNLARDLAHSVRFYERQAVISRTVNPRSEDGLQPNGSVVPIRTESRTAVIDPIKNSPSLGAVLALQAVDGALPVLHGAQGCSFLGKVLGIRHFNEPVALATTALFTEDVVLASEEGAVVAARKAAQAASPQVLALISTALTEVKGDDVDAAARQLAGAAPAVIAVRAPDYDGGLEAGFLAAVRALVGLATHSHRDAQRIAVFAGSHLTPGDVGALRAVIETFGFRPTMVPDLSALDGSRTGLSALASGGVALDELRSLGDCSHALVIGASLEPAARDLEARCGVPFTVLESIHGLEATDRLLAELAYLSGLAAPERYERDRRVLVDAMRDAHLVFAGARIVLALEPDHAASASMLLDDLAVPPATVVIPTPAAAVSRIRAAEIVIGDLGSVPQAVDVLVAGDRAAGTAAARGAAHVSLGFPQTDRYGGARRITVGYRGATDLVDEIANVLTARHGKEMTA